MDVSLGVLLSGTDARIVLLDAAKPYPVIDRLQVDLNADDGLVPTREPVVPDVVRALWLFTMTGSGDDVLLPSGIQFIINVVMTVPALIWLDRWGRRPTMLIGADCFSGTTYQSTSAVIDGEAANVTHGVENIVRIWVIRAD